MKKLLTLLSLLSTVISFGYPGETVNTTISSRDVWYFKGKPYFNKIDIGGTTGTNGEFILNGVSYSSFLGTPTGTLAAGKFIVGTSSSGYQWSLNGSTLTNLTGSAVTGTVGDSTLLNGQTGAYYLDLANATGTLAVARLSTSGVTAGSYTNATVQVDQYGRVVLASNGSGGGGISGVSGGLLTYSSDVVGLTTNAVRSAIDDVYLQKTGDGSSLTNLNASSIVSGVLTNTVLDVELSAIAGVSSAADKVPYYTGVGTASLADLTSAGRSLIGGVDAAAQRTTLGLATIASSGSAADLTTGTVASARLGTGTANSTTVLYGDSVYRTVGDITGITTGTGLTGGGTNGNVTVELADTIVTPGSYGPASITVDQQGRITTASTSSATVIGSVVDSRYIRKDTLTTQTMLAELNLPGINVTNTVSSGGLSVVGSVQLNGLTYPVIDGTTGQALTTDGLGGLTFTTIGSGSGSITGITAGTGLTGGGTNGNVTVELADTAVTPGSYGPISLTVDQQGRITAASTSTFSEIHAAAGNEQFPFQHRTGSNTNAIMRAHLLSGSGARGTLGQGSFDGQGYYDAAEGALGTESVIIGGRQNSISAASAYSVIVGGVNNFVGAGNTTTGYSFLGSGQGNTITTDIGYTHNVLVGGQNNSVSGYHSFIGGGFGNLTGNMQRGVVVGGENNDITGTNDYSGIGWGQNNTISTNGGTYNSVVGGNDNNIATAADNNTIGGGAQNDITATGNDHTISGGRDNNISGAGMIENTIGGGRENNISGYASVIDGGISHSISMGYSVIGGGRANYCAAVTNAGLYNTVAGGYLNGVIGGYCDFNYVGGGYLNVVGANNANESQDYGTIGGGGSNSMLKGAGNAGSSYATIAGGYDNDLTDASGVAVGGGMYHRVTPGTSFAGWGAIPGGHYLNVLAPSVGFTISGMSSKITFAQWGPVIAGGAGNCITGVGSSISVAATGVASTDVITAVGHTLRNGDHVYFSTITGGAGLVAYSQSWAGYFVRDISGSTFKLELLPGTTAVNFTTDISTATLVLPAGYASILGGHANTADQDDATILGGAHADTDHYGAVVHANGYNYESGDAQSTFVEAYTVTSDETPTVLFLDGLLLATKRFTVASGAVYQFTVQIAGVVHNGGNAAGYTIHGTIKNNGGTTSLVGTVTAAHTAEDDAAWDATVTADDANDALIVTVTGAAATTVHWHATISATKAR